MKKMVRNLPAHALLCSCLALQFIAPAMAAEPAPLATKKAPPAYKRQALAHMNAGRFKEAHELLAANLDANRDDLDIRFMLGQCAMQLKRPAEAVEHYQAMLAKNPDLPRVRLELARAYLALGERDKAREEFRSVQATNPPPTVGENIQRFLDSIAAQRPWQARVAASFLYDSNVNTGPDSSVSALPGFNLSGMTGKSDHAWGLTGNFNYTHAIDPGFAWQAEISAYILDYNRQDQSDQQILSASTGPAWKRDKWVISTPLIIDYVEVGHDYYNHSLGLAPQVRYALDKQTSVNAGLSFAENAYRRNSSDRDGKAYALNVSVRRQLEGGGFIQPGLRLGKEETGQDYFDASSYGVSLGWFTRLPWEVSLYVQPSVTRVEYGGADPLYVILGCSGCADTRRDWRYQLNLNFSKPLDKKGLTAALGVNLTRNDSSNALTDYKRAQITAMISKAF